MITLPGTVADEIVPGVFVGPESAASAWPGPRICVHEGLQPGGAVWLPILAAGVATRLRLENVANAIDFFSQRQAVLVYCQAGVERSPLAVAWYLHSRRGMSLAQAYALLQDRHPPTADCSAWIEKGAIPKMTLQEPTATAAPEPTPAPSTGEWSVSATWPPEGEATAPEAAADPFPSGFHYCQSGHRCGCDFGAAEPGQLGHGGHPCGFGGWELNADLEHPNPPQPAPTSEATEESPI
jgi:Dual specificity phosphatase, catalytic domain